MFIGVSFKICVPLVNRCEDAAVTQIAFLSGKRIHHDMWIGKTNLIYICRNNIEIELTGPFLIGPAVHICTVAVNMARLNAKYMIVDPFDRFRFSIGRKSVWMMRYDHPAYIYTLQVAFVYEANITGLFILIRSARTNVVVLSSTLGTQRA